MPIFFWLPMILFAGMFDVANDAMKPVHVALNARDKHEKQR